jgi:hypothetical protein
MPGSSLMNRFNAARSHQHRPGDPLALAATPLYAVDSDARYQLRDARSFEPGG